MLSRELSLLLAHGGAGEASDLIASNPGLMAELKDNLPAIQAACEAALAPAGDAEVARIVADRLPVYPQPERSEEEWAAWWRSYFDALSDLPVTSLQKAMLDWVRSPAQFLPKPGELRELAQKKGVPEYRANYIAKLAMRIERVPMTPEQAEARRLQVIEALDMIGRPKAKVTGFV